MIRAGTVKHISRGIPSKSYRIRVVQPSFLNARALHSANDSEEEKEKKTSKSGFLSNLLSKDKTVAHKNFKNRWLMIVPAFLNHLCIGTPWAWSVMSGPLSRELGVAASAASDWSMLETTYPLSIVFALQGISAAIGGSWALNAGPRKSMSLAALCFGGGLIIGGIGINMHSLPLLYAGYGVLAGAGVGLGYTPPVQALISWFPDKKGLASGLTIAGFGSGALVFTPIINKLMDVFSKKPEFLGTADDVLMKVESGRIYVQSQGADFFREAVNVTAAEISKLPYDLIEGFYAVGTGSTGAGTALSICGLGCGLIMLASAFSIKQPAPEYKPPGWQSPANAGSSASSAVAVPAVTASTVLKTPQFYLLGTVFFALGSGGIGLMSVAKPMMNEVFSSTLPSLVTAAFASQYVQMLAAGNLGGRIGWAAFSDKFGRRLTFNMFCLGSIPLYLSVPPLISSVITTQSAVPLTGFILSTALAMTFMGGTYSILPAYEADIFGSKYIGPIHGRMLIFSSAAALAGPAVLLQLRGNSEEAALQKLLNLVDPAVFMEKFQAPIESATELIASKTLTISKLMSLVPAGTIDPSPFIYDSTMYSAAGLMGIAAVAHSFVRPIDPKYHERNVPENNTNDTATEPKPK